MKILALDDEKLMLMNLVKCIHEAAPDAEVFSFSKSSEVLNFIKDNTVDIAFLDIKLRGSMTGIDVGKEILEYDPNTNIIFCTGYSEYGLAAIQLRCSGYVEKPVTVQAIKNELVNLRHPVGFHHSQRVFFQCFGNFEVFVDNKPVTFKNSKTKELLAYLVDRNGSVCTNREIMATLWEDGELHNSYLKKIRSELTSILLELNCEDILIIQHGGLGINKEKVDCDYYDWKNGLNDALYQGEYMMQYSWAETTISNY